MSLMVLAFIVVAAMVPARVMVTHGCALIMSNQAVKPRAAGAAS